MGDAHDDALEQARRRLFAPAATQADRDRFAALQRAADDEARAAVHAAPVPGAAAPNAAAAAEARAAPPARPRRRPRVVVALAVVGVLGALASLALGARPAPAARPAAARTAVAPSGSLAPPRLSGTVLLTTADTLDPVVSADPDAPEPATVVWNPGYTRLSATGRTVAVALRCRGAGLVEVVLTSGQRFAFPCTAAERTAVRTASASATPFTVLVPTTGRVLWAMTVATR